MADDKHPISRFRAEHKMTLDDFASLVGVKKSAVSKWAAGIGPSPASVITIEEKTGIPRHALRPDLWDAPSHAEAAQ